MPIPAHIQQAIQAYYAERATPDDVAALEAWFREDEANIKLFAEHGLLEWHMLCEHEKQDAAAIMTILREAEDKAEPDFSLLHTPAFESATAQTDGRPITFRELCSLAGYLTAKGLRTKAGMIGSLAAVVLLGVLLTLSLLDFGSTSDPAFESQEVVEATPKAPDTESAAIVATLTAEHNAAWASPQAEGALAPGSQLPPGQRLTLTAGFAEITTAAGAIAILEAPTTIELLDHNNAIRLHAGKLVGICETESSKGFLVRTPYMDITDLGTEFGVEVRGSYCTTTVFTGEVELTTPDGESRRLVTAQTARVNAGGNHPQVTIEKQMSSQFEGLLRTAISPEISGQGRILSPPPPRLTNDACESSDHISVLVEQIGVPWQQGWQADKTFVPDLLMGTSVDVFLLHFDPAGGRDELLDDPKACEALLVFDRPVVALITKSSTLVATDALLGISSVQYPVEVAGRGMESPPADIDRYELSDDRLTLRIRLNSGGGIDQVRVICMGQARGENE